MQKVRLGSRDAVRDFHADFGNWESHFISRYSLLNPLPYIAVGPAIAILQTLVWCMCHFIMEKMGGFFYIGATWVRHLIRRGIMYIYIYVCMYIYIYIYIYMYLYFYMIYIYNHCGLSENCFVCEIVTHSAFLPFLDANPDMQIGLKSKFP